MQVPTHHAHQPRPWKLSLVLVVERPWAKEDAASSARGVISVELRCATLRKNFPLHTRVEASGRGPRRGTLRAILRKRESIASCQVLG